jgi:hypothetical protein
MRRTWFVMLWVALSAGGVLAQRATQLPARPTQLPARPAAPSYGAPAYGAPAAAYPVPYGYPATYASTPAEGALNGMGNVISSKGNYNLSTSEAAVNMTQAQKNEIQNHQTYENTYFQMKETNQAYEKAHAEPRPTEEQLVRLARSGIPQPVSPSEVDPVSGKINWPNVLQQDDYSAQRSALEQLSAKKAANGSLSISDEMAARQTIEIMFAKMKSQILDVPTPDYIASRHFLQSMIYAMAHSPLT